MNRFALVVGLLFVAWVAPAMGATKPSKPPKPAICKRVMHEACGNVPVVQAPQDVWAVNTGTTLEFHASALTPGAVLYYIYEIWGVGNPYAYWRGGSGQVRSDGTIMVYEDIADLRLWAAPYELDEVYMWYGLPESWQIPTTNNNGVELKTEWEFQ